MDFSAKKASNADLSEEEILELEDKVSGGRHSSGAPRKAKNFGTSLKRLMALLAPYRLSIALVFGLVTLSVLLTVLAPLVTGRAIDVIFYGQGIDFQLLGKLIALIIGLYVLASVFMWLQGYLLNQLVMRIVRHLRSEVEAKIHRLPLSHFDKHQRGDILSRTTNDVDNIQQALQETLSQALNSLLMVLGIGVMMFSLSWQLAIVTLLAIPLTAVVIRFIGVRSQREFTAQWRSTGQLNAYIEEIFSGHDLIQIFGRADAATELFDERNEQLRSSATLAQFLSGLMMPIMQFISYLSYVAIAVLGGLMVAQGRITLGAATSFIQYSRQFNQPLGQLGGMMQMVQSAVASAERVFELIDAEEQTPDEAQVEALEEASGLVEFKNVSFSYDPEVPLIKDLSLRVEPGQTAAIVGPTGAGKTTLVNLITRFYEINAGQILLDGRDIRSLSRQQLRSQVGMVLQDAVLFGGSIMENIRYGRLEASDEEVIAAAKASYVDRFVHSLPDGYNTIIDPEGTTLSAGEKQLVTIARAFVKQPALLVLDEATSSVDTRTEVLVQKAMQALRAERTSFVIAHRLSTIRDADLIIVMAEGRIVEHGDHVSLMERQGEYYRLYNSHRRRE